MIWSTVPQKVEFLVEETPFAAGCFRNAFKARSVTSGFDETTWWVKKYLPSAVEIIKETNETEQTHTQKSVQMHYQARNFSSQWRELKNRQG